MDDIRRAELPHRVTQGLSSRPSRKREADVLVDIIGSHQI
jgi:hypothetical protein